MDFTRKFKFDASHRLPEEFGEKETHLHGHTYGIEITVSGPVIDGRVVDLVHLKNTVERLVVDVLDHSHLNKYFDVPSAENIARWSWDKLKPELPQLSEIRLYETRSHWVTYRGEQDG